MPKTIWFSAQKPEPVWVFSFIQYTYLAQNQTFPVASAQAMTDSFFYAEIQIIFLSSVPSNKKDGGDYFTKQKSILTFYRKTHFLLKMFFRAQIC